MSAPHGPRRVQVQLARVPIGVELSPSATNVLGEIAAALVSGARSIDEWPGCLPQPETCGARLLENLDQGGSQRHLHHCAGDGMDPEHAGEEHACSCGVTWSEVIEP